MGNKKNEIIKYENLKDSPNFQQSFDLHKELTLIELGDKEEHFHRSTLTSINNQIKNHSIIDPKTGILYFRVEGIHNILRTSPGIARNLVYQGVPPELNASPIINHNSKDYISQSSLMAILDYSISFSTGSKTRYMNYVTTSIGLFKTFEYLKNIRNKIAKNTRYSKSKMKSKKIKIDKIDRCQFTNKVFKSVREVEFAYIDSSYDQSSLIGDIKNGVIILKEIHAEMNKQNINDFVAMYKFCEKNNYDLSWTEKIDW
ncbi:MAG: hypothetical protein ATN31_06870 [Candidatus Epulonipiscioides saccharophilum]|nr:MAG: hypothetical protein ATN31_06870 [Epulopiscium sp. AS2M-Bin001]